MLARILLIYKSVLPVFPYYSHSQYFPPINPCCWSFAGRCWSVGWCDQYQPGGTSSSPPGLTSVPTQNSANMNILLEKERELMKLNLEIDERNKNITSESPQKKSGLSRGRLSKGRGSRPQSRSRSIELNFLNKDEEKFCWSQMSNQNPNNYIWAPMSQEELDHNNHKDARHFSIKPVKRLDRKMTNSIENVSSVSSGDND